VYVVIIIIIIIVIIRHELDLNGPVSALSDGLLKRLLGRLRPFGLLFNIIFGIPLYVVHVTHIKECPSKKLYTPNSYVTFGLWQFSVTVING
jgi:Na+/melibiose symporter-like transporter